MNIPDLIEESSSLDDLRINQTRIKLENLLPEPVNNNNYNDIRYNLDEVEAKYFQGFWQISNQSAEIDDEEKDQNLDSKKIKIIQESSKDYKDENNISEIKEEKKYLIEKKEEEKIFKLEKIPKSEKLSDNLFKRIKNEKNIILEERKKPIIIKENIINHVKIILLLKSKVIFLIS